MTFPKRRRDWKRVQASNLREAFRLCKEYGREKKNLSVEQIAELMAVSDDLLYKWLANGEMRANLIPTYEHVCGCHFVTEYLAASAGRLVVAIPSGRTPTDLEIIELQGLLTDTVRRLILFYGGEIDQEQAEQGLTASLKALAWQRENVRKADAPELELEEAE
jgi:transcriptional regulator with XRE-family HTH domain